MVYWVIAGEGIPERGTQVSGRTVERLGPFENRDVAAQARKQAAGRYRHRPQARIWMVCDPLELRFVADRLTPFRGGRARVPLAASPWISDKSRHGGAIDGSDRGGRCRCLALAIVARRVGHEVALWGRDAEAVARIASRRRRTPAAAGDRAARRSVTDQIARRAGRGGMPAGGGARAGAAVGGQGPCRPRTRRW